MKKRAFGYVRVSGKAQVQGDGLPRQTGAIKGYCQIHSIELVQIFREEGVSGASPALARPAFSAMLAALHGNGVRTIVVERLDRLARDLVLQETILADLRKHGFELISVVEPDLMANDPSRNLLRQLVGSVSEYEKATLVLKLRGARQRMKARTGSCEGAKVFGHYPGEKRIIERMKALRAEGLGYDRIAAKLNAEGVKPRRGAKWWGLTVNKILSGKGRRITASAG